MRTRTFPSFLSTGLLWGVSTDEEVGALRYNCRQDELPTWGYTRHDGRYFGAQELNDSAIRAELHTTHVVQPQGTSWSARIDAKAELGQQLALHWHLALDCDGALDQQSCVQDAGWGRMEVKERALDGYSASYIVRGRSEIAPRWAMEVNVRQHEQDTATYYGSADVGVLQLKDRIERDMRLSKAPRKQHRATSMFEESGDLKNEVAADLTLLVFRVGCRESCEVEITFHGDLDESEADVNPVTDSATILAAAAEAMARFEERFARAFPLPDSTEDSDRESAKRALSSQLSGIGFFYGTPEIRDSAEVEQKAASPVTPAPIVLFTGTPSRPFFPRGFLWDEGFHLLQLADWDPSMAMFIVAHWLNAMYIHTASTPPGVSVCKGGWIPREMILGAEAATRVPSEFIPQHVDIANPPTLLLAVEKLATIASRSAATCPAETPESCAVGDANGDDSFGSKFNQFLEKFAPALDRWVQWFLHSQAGPAKTPGSFRWRGRPANHEKLLTNTLASGLDDYPRAAIPTADEHHVDLLAWMIRACQIMAKLQDHLAALGKARSFNTDYKALSEQLAAGLDTLHWSDELKAYADVGLDSKKGQIVSEIVFRCGRPSDAGTVDIGVSEQQLRSRSVPCPSTHPRPMYPLGDGQGGLLTRDRYVIRSRAMMHLPHIGYATKTACLSFPAHESERA